MTALRSRLRRRSARPRAVVALLAALAVVTGASSACGDDGGDDDSEQAAGDVVLVRSDAARAEPAPDAPVDEVVAGLDAFALRAERLAAADAEGGNTVLSPISIGTAFAMVSAGAGEPTGAQIDQVFGFPAHDRVHPAMNALTAALDDANVSDPERGDVVVEATNTLWAQRGFDIEPAFLDTLATDYGAAVPTVDFEADPEAGRRAINDQVAEATRDRITDLMAEGTVTRDTRAVVVNAVYLKAPWATEFSEDATEPRTFHLADGGTAEVPMMRDAMLSADAAVGDGYAAVELPYVGGELAMLVVVPDRGTSLDDVLAGLGEGGLGAVAASLRDASVDLTLPRWDTGSATDLGPLLTELGLPIPGGTLPGVAPDLELSAAVHAADITVDEHGTEAAAATGVGMEATSAPVPGEIVEIVADRPFLFAVRHVGTGAPLFLGRVGDPRG